MATHSGNSWWLRLTCFFFFGGLSCFVPFLTAHLQWIGLTLEEVAVVQLVSGLVSSLGWFVAATRTPRCGQRATLALAVLLAALCGAALLLVPRIHDRLPSSDKKESPLAEILCRPEGSALFFRKCGDTCDLDAARQTELTISDCRFEAESELPGAGNYVTLVNKFGAGFIDSGETESGNSQPERGDLPDKADTSKPQEVVALAGVAAPPPPPPPPLLLPSSGEASGQPDQTEDYPVTDYDAFNLDANNASSEPYDQYDYDRNHPEMERSRRRRNDAGDASDADDAYQYENSNNNPDEKELPPGGSSPHICFSRDQSSTTCHVFLGTDHQFRLNTSFYSGMTRQDRCFYSLRYDDLHVLSELRCRSNVANQHVRCRADGVTLRTSVTQNGTRTCRHHAESSPHPAYSYATFWLYLVFRSVGELCVIGSVILLYAVTLNRDMRRGAQRWWLCGLVGLVALAPLAGYVNDQVGFGVGFLLGSLLFGLAALMIAVSPTPTTPATSGDLAPVTSFTCVSQVENQSDFLEQQVVKEQLLLRQCLSVRGVRLVLSYPSAVLVLAVVFCFGAASGVTPTTLHWYFLELGASRLMLGASMSAMLICIPLIFPLSGWLWKRCGSHYIFIIGLLFYSIRFLGFLLVDRPIFLVAIETLEPLCSIWMLVTASAHIQRHLAASSRINSGESSLAVNSWALIIVFHYSFGRGVGSAVAALATHHLGVVDVFIGAAVMTLLGAAVWFTCLHAPNNCCSKNPPEKSKKRDTSPSHRGGKGAQDRSGDSYTQVGNVA